MGIQGRIGKTTSIEVISFLNSAGVTGTLTFKGFYSIDIIFEYGSVIGYFSKYNGTSIYKQIGDIRVGSYSFVEHGLSAKVKHKKNIESTKAFIYMIAKNMDIAYVNSDVYETEMEFEISKNFSLKNVTLDVNEWRIIAILSNRSDIRKIKSILHLSYQEISKILFSLEQIGIIKRIRKNMKLVVNANIINSIKLFLSSIKLKTKTKSI